VLSHREIASVASTAQPHSALGSISAPAGVSPILTDSPRRASSVEKRCQALPAVAPSRPAGTHRGECSGVHEARGLERGDTSRRAHSDRALHHRTSALRGGIRHRCAPGGSKEPPSAPSLRAGPLASSSASLQPTTTTSPPGVGGASPPPATASTPSGCAAALAYLASHAAPGFVASCPHADGGYQATTTCIGAPRCLPGTAFIWIADPCPAAYMNEASNSWVLIGRSSAPIDPYGYCGEPGNPYG
jgi:hypothetical protein